VARKLAFVLVGLVAMQVSGWILVSVFDISGSPAGVDQVFWRIGGLMVYASSLGFFVVAAAAIVAALVLAAQRAMSALHG
jgi:hypothetical protein